MRYLFRFLGSRHILISPFLLDNIIMLRIQSVVSGHCLITPLSSILSSCFLSFGMTLNGTARGGSWTGSTSDTTLSYASPLIKPTSPLNIFGNNSLMSSRGSPIFFQAEDVETILVSVCYS